MTDPEMDVNTHATLVALEWKGAWHGILIRGNSGAGKSSLALGLVEAFRRAGHGAGLVSDDQVLITLEQGIPVGRAPKSIVGKVEIRGHGIAATEHLVSAPVTLVVSLVPDEEIERMPEPSNIPVGGVPIAHVKAPLRHEAQAVRIVQAAITGRHF